ncbi:hypothetical protein QUF75_02215 [Desulfococcaceae bacterium HSG7]|nr:hypothetical protein [Desulfococcaceae bacterium HSG7]
MTKKVGIMPPGGTILVEADDEYQGIQREVLQPSMQYINPYHRMSRLKMRFRLPTAMWACKLIDHNGRFQS